MRRTSKGDGQWLGGGEVRGMFTRSVACKMSNHISCTGRFDNYQAPWMDHDPGYFIGRCDCPCHIIMEALDGDIRDDAGEKTEGVRLPTGVPYVLQLCVEKRGTYRVIGKCQCVVPAGVAGALRKLSRTIKAAAAAAEVSDGVRSQPGNTSPSAQTP